MEDTKPSRIGTRLLAFAFLAALCAAVLLSVPWDADPGWWDASRHAMDGAFYMDVVRQGGYTNPVGYAQDYYTRYPAIAPVLYPPLFGVVEAALFVPFGPHPWVARLLVALFLLWGAWGVRRLALDIAGPLAGLAAGALYVSMPLVFEWSREVMLETPAAAFVIWGFVYGRGFLATGRTRDLALCLACGVLGTYTKQTAIFVLPAMLLATLLAGRARLLAQRRAWIGVACAAIAGLPLAYVTLKWGRMNLEQASGSLAVGGPRSTFDHIVYHAGILPETVGWPVLLLAIAGAVLLARRGRLDLSVLGAWLVVCYAMIAFVRIKDPRQGFFWTPPFAVAAGLGLARLAEALPRARVAVVAAAAAGVMAFAVARAPMNWCDGFGPAAKDVRGRWEGAALLVSVEHDGNLIFRLRALDPELQLRVYRSEKIFESMRVYKKAWGTEAKVGSAEELCDAIGRYGIRYVLAEDDIRDETAVESMLRQVVRSDRFEPVAAYDIRYPGDRPRRVGLYRYRGTLADPPESPTFYLPIAGMEFQK